MDILGNHRKRLDQINTGQRDRRIKRAIDATVRKFEGDPSFFHLNSLEPDGITTSTKRVRIINADYVTHLNPNRIHSRFFVSHPEDTMLTGTTLFNLYSSDWMVTASADLTEILERGMIQRINHTAKWYKDRILYQNNCIISGVSRRSDGIDENRYMTLPEDAVMMIIPKNEATKTIKDDMRFIIYDAPYKVTKEDRYTELDLALFILQKDEFRPGDDRENEIADVPTDLEVELLGKSFVAYGSFASYELLNESVPAWVVTEGEEYLSAHQVNAENANIYEIMVIRNSNFIGKQIKLQATVDGVVYEKIITIATLS